ncbi:tRNA 2'-phosphotransferase 1-like isoform X1 [Homalodisca vitripennis]|uniref:tRNA 2'-phosphotransferase 1-like isoform X1 n=1 Tax=Homalodisca vitripennis TaxID=197043 RepID=UPI001EEC909F|nr:tRNA 2'-phosphotransferase 1-like isoform X1 [Homalodisca vitripennis]
MLCNLKHRPRSPQSPTTTPAQVSVLPMRRVTWASLIEGNKSAKDLSLSKSLSWLLRHGAITEGLTVNENGYIQLEQVLQHRLFARRCTAADIRRVITLSKNRFSLQANPKTGIYEIRANSGHTFKDSNNQEVKAVVKLNRGRPIPQPGLRTVKNSHSQSENLRNYNLPVGNIRLSEEEEADGRHENDKLMKYTELKKALVWILRHGAEKEGLTVKRHGYVSIDQVLNHAYFKNKCMREDILTVVNNEPYNFKIREGSRSQKLYIRARKEHPIKQEQEDWSVIQGSIYLPLDYIVHGINGSDWDYVSQNGLKVSSVGYLYFSPYEPSDCWHTRGVYRYDDIYVYINAHAAMQDGIEFFRTAEDSVATKGDSEGFIGTQYFRKVVEAQTGNLLYSDGSDDE